MLGTGSVSWTCHGDPQNCHQRPLQAAFPTGPWAGLSTNPRGLTSPASFSYTRLTSTRSENERRTPFPPACGRLLTPLTAPTARTTNKKSFAALPLGPCQGTTRQAKFEKLRSRSPSTESTSPDEPTSETRSAPELGIRVFEVPTVSVPPATTNAKLFSRRVATDRPSTRRRPAASPTDAIGLLRTSSRAPEDRSNRALCTRKALAGDLEVRRHAFKTPPSTRREDTNGGGPRPELRAVERDAFGAAAAAVTRQPDCPVTAPTGSRRRKGATTKRSDCPRPERRAEPCTRQARSEGKHLRRRQPGRAGSPR